MPYGGTLEEKRSKRREYGKRYREENPAKILKHREYWNKHSRYARYGITKDEFDHVLADQDSRCAACGSSEHGGRNWVMDHCHSTGRNRGILCNTCNVALGMLQDSPYRLTALSGYLARTSGEGNV